MKIRTEKKIEGGLRTKGLFSKKTEPDKPLISIITICLNSEKYLEQTIKSIVEQTYDHIEHIIIDGASTDGTLDIIRKYDDKIAYWVSEPDKGVSDAYNKGILHSTGDYLNFLNSDDYLFSKDTILAVAKSLVKKSPWIAYGKIAVLQRDSGAVYYVQGDTFKAEDFKRTISVPHQGYFISRKYFDKYGLFDKKLSMLMDYDHLLRGIYEVKVEFMDFIVVNFRTGGKSDTYKRIIERFYVHKRHGVTPKWYPYTSCIYSSLRWVTQKILERLHLKWVISMYAKVAYKK